MYVRFEEEMKWLAWCYLSSPNDISVFVEIPLAVTHILNISVKAP
jgi:hypothetical protein